jgi:hypothetical protein
MDNGTLGVMTLSTDDPVDELNVIHDPDGKLSFFFILSLQTHLFTSVFHLVTRFSDLPVLQTNGSYSHPPRVTAYEINSLNASTVVTGYGEPVELVKNEVWRYWAVHHTAHQYVLSPLCIVSFMGKKFVYCFSLYRALKPDGSKEHFRWTCVLAHPDGNMIVDKVSLSRITPSMDYVSLFFFIIYLVNS